MPVDVVIAIAALSAALALTVWLLPQRDPVRRRVLANLKRDLDVGVQTVVGRPYQETQPRRGLGVLARRVLPGGVVRRVERLHAHAGAPAGWPVDRLLAAKLVLPVVVAALGAAYANAVPGPLSVAVTVGAAVAVHFLPELLLHSRAQERNERIALELADVLDQVTVCVEAGLGFDAAVARSGRDRQSPLGEELRRVQRDIRLGQSRRQAYEGMLDRTGAPDLARFVRSVIQADAYGVPMAEVLRTQSAEARRKRRQQAEEKAMQIPTKVVFPLVLLILPVMFVVLLGPAVIGLIATLR